MMEYYNNFPVYSIFTKVGQKIKNCDFVSKAAQVTFISEVVSGIITIQGRTDIHEQLKLYNFSRYHRSYNFDLKFDWEPTTSTI